MDSMRHIAKKYFIPHEGNNYHPHILHTKRVVLYGLLSIATKAIVVLFVLLLPTQVFLLPDVLAVERGRIISMTNALRGNALSENSLLNRSATLKTADMATNRYFDHVGPQRRNLQFFLTQAGYPYDVAGENLAMGFSTAEEVIAAWKNSPTHYANILDADFEDIGVGIEAGEYDGIPTVYITQHFGRRKKTPTVTHVLPVITTTPVAPVTTSPETRETTPAREDIVPVTSSRTLGERVSETPMDPPNTPPQDAPVTVGESVPLPIVLDADHSSLLWRDVEEGKTKLIASAIMSGPVKEATVSVKEYTIPLAQATETPDLYYGELIIPITSDVLFDVVTLPTVSITDMNGTVTTHPLRWERVKVVSPTPIEKYTKSKAVLGSITSIFTVSKTIYGVLFFFFLTALILNIVIEFKKQHPHVIAQTTALLALFLFFFFF
ncbi:MAG TPA: CAP domain-containing protein [Candidatus Kapabacteria bacterium]|nr:CAP domain-containing protein [Candidatus Kapabacteria bacterium]